MKMYSFMVMALLCCGCCSPQYTERSEIDTLSIPVPAIIDSGSGISWDDWWNYISPDSSVNITVSHDSTITSGVDSGKVKWHTKYIIKPDSIPYPVETTKWLPQEKETYPFLSKLGLILLGLAIGAGLGVILGKKSLISIGGK